MLKFAPRVAVLSTWNRPLFHTHAEHAQRMVARGQAHPVNHGHRVREIRLAHETQPRGAPTYRGRMACAPQRTTVLEHLREPIGPQGQMVTIAKLIQHRRIHPKSWMIYRSAIVECLPREARAELHSLFAQPHREAGFFPPEKTKRACILTGT